VGPRAVDFRPETLVAIDTVERALELARQGGGAGQITSKGGRDIVTATDVAVEDLVRDRVSRALGVPVVGEERGGEAPADGSPYWLVDPICGTRNFASGSPLYCVNLALVERNQISVAVVGDPSTADVLVAERGYGAWALRGGGRGRLRTDEQSYTVIIEIGRAPTPRRERAAEFLAGAARLDRWDLRALGTTLSLPYVAAGRVAAYVLFWASAVHTGAGSLLVTEAGGSLSDIDGRPWTIQSDSIVASATPNLHRDLVELARRTTLNR